MLTLHLRSLDARYPEWWILGLCGAAWIITIFPGHLLHAHPWLGPLVMSAAMMLPISVPMARFAAYRSKWTRRHRAIALFTLPYVGLWTSAALCLEGIERWVLGELGVGLCAALAFCAAGGALWHASPLQVWVSRACHRKLPLPPNGWRADLQCVRLGAWHATACIASCWALMLICALFHGVVVMGAVAMLCFINRLQARGRDRYISAGLAVLACAAAILAVSA